MKTSRTILAALLLMAAFPIAGRHGTLVASARDRSGDPGAYTIDLQVSRADGRSTFRYTIAKATAETHDLGHFIIDLAGCGDQGPTIANIVSATVDGVDWSDRLETTCPRSDRPRLQPAGGNSMDLRRVETSETQGPNRRRSSPTSTPAQPHAEDHLQWVTARLPPGE